MSLERIWPKKLEKGEKVRLRIPEVSEEVNTLLGRYEEISAVGPNEKFIKTKEKSYDGLLIFRSYHKQGGEYKLVKEDYGEEEVIFPKNLYNEYIASVLNKSELKKGEPILIDGKQKVFSDFDKEREYFSTLDLSEKGYEILEIYHFNRDCKRLTLIDVLNRKGDFNKHIPVEGKDFWDSKYNLT